MGDVKMVLLGDTSVSSPDPASAFTPAMDLLKDADIRFRNRETIVADAHHLHPYDRSRLPRTEEWMFESYGRAGFDVMNQANNPNTYHGHEPIMRSFEVLDAAGIIHSGAGPNLAEASKPAIIERNGTKIAFVSRTSVGTPGMEATVDTPGVAFYPIQTLYEPPARVHSNPGRPSSTQFLTGACIALRWRLISEPPESKPMWSSCPGTGAYLPIRSNLMPAPATCRLWNTNRRWGISPSISAPTWL